ncbi:hypothetical protein D9619_009507 [Psilocybe cf. subviscida]|uniref:Uncharacterized protein n=1 Tax=Psilocybe cf. subviscida TaxID=2480587 RepID=A0A8H5BU39_9AGAR|nr:hypothetical protein D9619_009507 [Psilocybe cf. subviscida]
MVLTHKPPAPSLRQMESPSSTTSFYDPSRPAPYPQSQQRQRFPPEALVHEIRCSSFRTEWKLKNNKNVHRTQLTRRDIGIRKLRLCETFDGGVIFDHSVVGLELYIWRPPP